MSSLRAVAGESWHRLGAERTGGVARWNGRPAPIGEQLPK